MSREIKFRAWLKKEKGWVQGFNMVNFHSYFNKGLEPNIYRYSTEWKLSEIELCQFTGLKDKNGIDIYEGDILVIDGGGKEKPVMDVRWEIDYAMWVVYPDWLKNQELAKPDHVPLNAYTHPAMNEMISVEIIGNIYSNPELLNHKLLKIMDTTEGNKIIAEFDGWIQLPDFVNGDNEVFPYYMKEFNGRQEFIHYHPNKYHSSWDWLHGAWDKFSKMQLKEVGTDNDERYNDTYGRHLTAISNAIIHYKIEVAHYRLVRAIQWYNNQIKQHG